MKNVLFITLFVIGLSVSANLSAQKIPPTGCPPGTHAVISYEFDSFNFHRPKFNCEKGFWFCFKGGHWESHCEPNTHTATLTNNIARVWARESGTSQLEIHFPIGLKSLPEYSDEDLLTFNVDEEYEVFEGITLKTGDYSVRETDTELIVLVDIL